MEKQQYLYKIYPPRSDFYSTQGPNEQKIMAKHIEYWQQLTDKKSSLVYGPVYEPAGTFPMAVIEVTSKEEAEGIAINDPAVFSGAFTYSLFPMQADLIRRDMNPAPKKAHR